jgi:hypothetical protein
MVILHRLAVGDIIKLRADAHLHLPAGFSKRSMNPLRPVREPNLVISYETLVGTSHTARSLLSVRTRRRGQPWIQLELVGESLCHVSAHPECKICRSERAHPSEGLPSPFATDRMARPQRCTSRGNQPSRMINVSAGSKLLTYMGPPCTPTVGSRAGGRQI